MKNIIFQAGSKVLEIGGGNNPICDKAGNRASFNVDIVPGENVDLVRDLSVFPWEFEDESWDGVFSKYSLEHIEWRKIDQFISEVFRILRPSGKAVFFVPNTLEQCKKIAEEGINKGTIEMLFGSQEFPDYAGVHKTGFSPEYAKELFKKNGFSIVKTFPHPQSSTDMIIEAYKFKKDEIFERKYFDGDIGYIGAGFRDFATHYAAARFIEEHKPKSVIDIGGARGYVVRILEADDIPSVCMDISRHCEMTRATDSFVRWDAMDIPWTPFNDKQFDIAFSINFFEHIPLEHLDDVIRESMRVSKRGIHGIHMTDAPFEEMDIDVDITHQISQPSGWWHSKFHSINPDYEVIIEHPRMIEYEKPEHQPPITVMPPSPDKLVKLNLGCFQDMFYDGWINIDILDLKVFAEQQAYEFIQQDLTQGIPFQDNSVDIIMSNHLIEHITREEGKQLLKECYRVLKPGGIIRFSTPDTQIITKQYLDGKIMEYKYINTGVEKAEDEAEAYYNLLIVGHKTIYDEKSLIQMMTKAGFENIIQTGVFESRSPVIKKQTITTHPNISLVVEAQKP